MSLLKLLLSFILISDFYDILFYLLGRLLYRLGKRKIGHYFVGISIAGDFVKAKKLEKGWQLNAHTNTIVINVKYVLAQIIVLNTMIFPQQRHRLRSVGIKIILSA